MSGVEQAYGLLIGWEWIVLGYFLLVNSYMALLLISAAWETWQNSLSRRLSICYRPCVFRNPKSYDLKIIFTDFV
jgi:hypothetical protein